MSVILGFAPRSLPARLATVGCRHSQAKLGSLVRQIPKERTVTTQRSTGVKDIPLAYTWLTRTPDEITPDDVLSSLPPIPGSLTPSDYVPILLATSPFAHWVDSSSHGFLEQWINRFYPSTNLDPAKPVHAIVAVVDKLPDHRVQSGEAVDGICTSESEGISLLLVKAENIQGKVAAPRRVRSMEVTESSLVFALQNDTSTKLSQRPTHEIGLRLANTIFVNGNDNTLFGTRWVYTSSHEYALEQSVNLSNCKVTSAVTSVRDSFNLPLYPVGQRRRVISSMGNILRQLAKHTDSQSAEPMPASSELEKELPRYIEEHGIADRRVSVWALIESSEKGFQMGTDLNSQESLVKAIRAGAKLHRVMSGGGGWGKKQGLLSLDPETTFIETEGDGLLELEGLFAVREAHPVSDVPPPPPAFFDMPQLEDSLSTLSQAAGPGDYIQFFVSVEPDHAPNPRSEEGSIAFNFGIVSDAESVVQATDRTQKDLVVASHYFGALSEKAITYLQPVTGAESSGVQECSAKFDIPGCRVQVLLE
ncbi:V-type ATPase [Aspergillus sclerotiicarbonarius CBS 121057]|uniref:V-type ATPase n=1 Tax=Aspergillus sclerotiicarbonarius (strain CBS 121057 / IBT 28362) TaxID=1448318 RepID=A0A319EJ42_ASPSB|nr:V-type ATPase [Aspergillus sclerotiicarbonarius CBS 121057]